VCEREGEKVRKEVEKNIRNAGEKDRSLER
jgi:hypothetical protein